MKVVIIAIVLTLAFSTNAEIESGGYGGDDHGSSGADVNSIEAEAAAHGLAGLEGNIHGSVLDHGDAGALGGDVGGADLGGYDGGDEGLSYQPQYGGEEHVDVPTSIIEHTKPVPITVVKKVGVPVPHPISIPVPQIIKVPVSQPIAVHESVPQPVPIPIYKLVREEIETKVPITIEKPEPVYIDKPYKVEIERHYPVPVAKPYPVYVPVYKHVYVSHQHPHHH